MSTVFISNMSEHDYSSATQFGALRFVTSGNYPIYKTSRLMEEIAETLAESTQEDHLLLSGSAVIAALCMTVWLTYHSRINILLYDHANNVYEERKLDKSSIRVLVERIIDRREGRVPERI